MSPQTVYGHDNIANRFRSSLAAERMPSTFLFVGPDGIGKRTFALKLAQGLFCENTTEAELEPCGHCHGCAQVLAGTHPDLFLISRPAEKANLPIDLFIGEGDKRNREGLCFDIARKPQYGGRKIAIIDDADFIAAESANALLKTLEEPPPKSILILIGTSEAKQLSTIRSRSQIIRFNTLPPETVEKILLEQKLVETAAEATALAAMGGGSVSQALALGDESVRSARRQLLQELASGRVLATEMSQWLGKFVDDAGKDGASKRARLRQSIQFCMDLMDAWMRQLCDLESFGDEDIRSAVATLQHRCEAETELAADALERCIEADRQVSANANQATLIYVWLDDVLAILRGARVGS
jgi:DNA polymerase-3 subunit delta'